mgnify:CR=1 FL=1
MRKIVEIKNLVKSYGGKDYQTKVLKNINLDIYENDFIAIMGPSGAGKSTLLNMLSTLDKPTRGEIIIDGEDITKVNNKRLSKIRQEKIGFIFQGFNLIPSLTAQANVELPLVYRGMAAQERHELSIKALERVGLGHRLDHRPSEMSGGQQQRVAIARAVAARPPVILADEPTGALDSQTSRVVMDLFHELHEKYHKTIVLITHNPELAEECQRVLTLRDGLIVGERKGTGERAAF